MMRRLDPRDLGARLVGMWDPRSPGSVLNDGDAVASLADLSTAGNNLTQVTAAQKPLYYAGARGIQGRPSLWCDGSNDNLANNLLASYLNGDHAAFSVFVVAQRTAPANTGTFWSAGYATGSTPFRNLQHRNAQGVLQCRASDQGSGDRDVRSDDGLGLEPFAVVLSVDGSRGALTYGRARYRVAQSNIILGSGALNTFAFGALVRNTAGSGWGGLLGTMGLVKDALSRSEAQQVWQWLADEWGL